MKNLKALSFITALVITFSSGCSPEAAEQASGNKPLVLKDGVYSVQGSIDDNGWTPYMKLKVDGEKIAEVIYDEIAATKKTENPEYQLSFKAQTKLDLLEIYKALQNNLIANQAPEKLDAIAGATKAYDSFQALAQKALSNAKEGESLKDGVYSAEGETDEKGWSPVISITVKDKKITAVKYDEVSSKIYKNKALDKAYKAKYMEQKKIDLMDVYNSLQTGLLEKQDPAKVDAYSGATATSSHFKELAQKAMEQASK